MAIKLIIVGPNAGKSMEILGVKFVDGKGELVETRKNKDGQDESIDCTCKINLFAKYHNVHVEGGESHKRAQAVWEENKGPVLRNGKPISSVEAPVQKKGKGKDGNEGDGK